MLSKNKIKYIHSLELKKTRKEEQVFLAEGPKFPLPFSGCDFFLATSASRHSSKWNCRSLSRRTITCQSTENATASTCCFRATAIYVKSGVRTPVSLPGTGWYSGPGEPGYDYPTGGLVRYRTYYLLSEYGRRIQSQDHTSHYGRNCPC